MLKVKYEDFFQQKNWILCSPIQKNNLERIPPMKQFYPVIWKILGLFSSSISREIDHP